MHVRVEIRPDASTPRVTEPKGGGDHLIVCRFAPSTPCCFFPGFVCVRPYLVQVKGLFKAQRDEPSRASLALDSSSSGTGPSNFGDDTGSMAVTGTLKSALRVACDVTAKI